MRPPGFAHLGARIPITGFAYQWNSRLINPHYGWFTGYTALLAFMAGTAATAVALASVFASDIWKSPTHGDIVLFAAVAIAAAALINIISIRAVSAVNNTGVFFEIILQVVVFLAIFSCVLANMVVATRLTFALSRDKMLPGSALLGRVNATTRTPIASILLVAAVGIGINLLSAGVAANVVSICSVAYYFIYALTVGGAIYAYRKRNMPDHRPGDFSLGRWFVPVAVVAFVYAAAPSS